MATKTISLELDAYERLKRFKLSERESFSQVVRRAVWPEAKPTAGDVLAHITACMSDVSTLPGEDVLNTLDRRQEESNRSPSKWQP